MTENIEQTDEQKIADELLDNITSNKQENYLISVIAGEYVITSFQFKTDEDDLIRMVNPCKIVRTVSNEGKQVLIFVPYNIYGVIDKDCNMIAVNPNVIVTSYPPDETISDMFCQFLTGIKPENTVVEC